jgi:hypothetical protein
MRASLPHERVTTTRPTSDAWLRAALAVATLQAALLGIVHARPGLTAVVLWYVGPVLVGLAAAALLALALARSWRQREVPDRRTLAGFGVLALVVASLAFFRVYPSSHDNRPSGVRFRLPLDGPVTVAWGGPTVAANYHGIMPDQRWAYDLLVTVDGRSFRGEGTRLGDYHAYGLPVLAPADGIVRVAHDREPDGAIGQWGVWRALGNYVVLEVAPAEFLFIAHLQSGSVGVGTGSRVRAGQVLGRVGNSGNSSEPHVHVHLQDTPRPHLGEGIPFYFHGYRVRGHDVTRGMPLGGRAPGTRSAPAAFTGDIVEHIAE